MKKPLPEPIFFTLHEVAALLKVSYNTVYEMVVKKELKAIKVGGQWRVLKTEFFGCLKQFYGEALVNDLVA
jgi:excisionase family DNA binding protein